MPVVTISATLGAGGTEVGQMVASLLGIGYVDRAALVQAARDLGVPATSAAGADDRRPGFGVRVSSALRGLLERSATASPADPFLGAPGLEVLLNRTYGEAVGGGASDQRYQEILSSVVRDLAAGRSVVVVGRGAQAILAKDEDATHVLLDAAVDRRVERLMQRDGSSREEAERRIRESDRTRREFHQKFFKVELLDLRNYHLALNTGRLSDALAAEIIAGAARARSREG